MRLAGERRAVLAAAMFFTDDIKAAGDCITSPTDVTASIIAPDHPAEETGA